MRNLIWLSAPAAMEAAFTGGKGANLGRLMQMRDVRVPGGFVITTEVYRRICSGGIMKRLKLTGSLPELEREAEQIRQEVQAASMPEDAAAELENALSQYADGTRFAVRSSSTAEDLSDASFAGQQDSYLNVEKGEVQAAVMRCFASLYNDRAIAYRAQNGFCHEEAVMAVVVQEMVDAQCAGVLFTADPLTSDRHTCVAEAAPGLGEGLVSGHCPPFTWRVREGRIKPSFTGKPPLDDEKILSLVRLGRDVEAAFGEPLDLEWCYLDGRFYVVQARAVTTLFPVPESRDGLKRFFVSAGHMQMMTDVILPLGISFMKRIALFQMVECGGRLFIDITHDMKTLYGRKMISTKLAAMDPLTYGAVRKVMQQKEYLRSIPKGPGSFSDFHGWLPMVREGMRMYRRNNTGDIDAYVERMERSVEALERTLAPLSGEEALRAILDDQKQLFGVLYDAEGFGMILAVQFVIQRIDRIGRRLTGEEHLSNRLSLAVEHNPASGMGLALSEAADMIRKEPAAVSYLERAQKSFCLEELRQISGPAADALEAFLRRYGMRATGEIDISKTRFRENPAELISTILTDIRTLPKGYGRAAFLEGQEAMRKLTKELLDLAEEKLGRPAAGRLRRYISFFRNFVGTREYPKYFWVCRYDIYKRALQRTAEELVSRGVLKEADDLYYLYLEEVQELLRTGAPDMAEIRRRKEDYRRFQRMTPPRLIFSDGEVPEMGYSGKLPPGAMAGLGVSPGIAEGRARVVRAIGEAVMEPGDILVTTFTDPSWTPVFVSIAGLVTEVGGMMTHGAVVTREYGLPAVVGVADATRLIRDGDRIRIDGGRGIVEILGW